MGEIFRAGGLAPAYVEIAEFYQKHAEHVGACSVLVPFSGFGRVPSGMWSPNCSVDTVDFQIMSRFIVEGVHKAKEFVSNVDKPRFRKGVAYGGELDFKKGTPDLKSKGFIDWVAAHGTDLDKAAIGMSVPAMTRRGWLDAWTGNFDKLWNRFNTVRDEFRVTIGVNQGEWTHYEADFFRVIPSLKSHYSVIAVDPPRLCPTQDLYSQGGWVKLNRVLGGEVEIKSWTYRNYFELLRRMFTISSDYILFTWADSGMSSVRTSLVKEFLMKLGEVEDEQIWKSYSKDIICWRVKRHGC